MSNTTDLIDIFAVAEPKVDEAKSFIKKEHFSEKGGGFFSLGIGTLVDTFNYSQRKSDYNKRKSTLREYLKNNRVDDSTIAISAAKEANAMRFINSSYNQDTTNQNEYIGGTLSGTMSRSIGREFAKTQDLPQKIIDSLQVPEFRQNIMSAMIQNTKDISTQKANLQDIIKRIERYKV